MEGFSAFVMESFRSGPGAKLSDVEPADFLADLQRMSERLAALPPPIWRIVTHHSVPWGRAFKQYDTKGRLILWVNRGWVEDLPRKVQAARSPLDSPYIGIPVYHDG